MSQKKNPYQTEPSYPTAPNGDTFNPYPQYTHPGPPPPYDASFRPEYRYPPCYDQSVNQRHMTHPQAPNYGMQAPSTQYMNQIPSGNQQYAQQMPGGPQVLEFDHGARTNMKNGSLTVPPPPPGYAPTPAQLAALQGRPVIVTQKKKSFF